MNNFTGKVVLVTGSTQNLGLCIARAFIQAGAQVVIHGPTQAQAEEAAARLRVELPQGKIEAAGFDLGTNSSIDAGFSELGQRALLPDILVNNAAHLGLGADTSFLGQTPDFFRQVIEVNLFAVVRCSQLAAEEMRRRGSGAIIHISSLAGERAIWGRTAYAAGKAAVDGLTRAMALELAPLGIRVNAIAPGYVWTPRWNDLKPEQIARRKANTPGREPTQADEIARLALFLASDQAPSLIGSRIVIDGGLNAQQVPADVAV